MEFKDKTDIRLYTELHCHTIVDQFSCIPPIKPEKLSPYFFHTFNWLKFDTLLVYAGG